MNKIILLSLLSSAVYSDTLNGTVTIYPPRAPENGWSLDVCGYYNGTQPADSTYYTGQNYIVTKYKLEAAGTTCGFKRYMPQSSTVKPACSAKTWNVVQTPRVEQLDYSCCANSWDNKCIFRFAQVCNGANPATYPDCADINIITAADPYCKTTAWDTECIRKANILNGGSSVFQDPAVCTNAKRYLPLIGGIPGTCSSLVNSVIGSRSTCSRNWDAECIRLYSKICYDSAATECVDINKIYTASPYCGFGVWDTTCNLLSYKVRDTGAATGVAARPTCNHNPNVQGQRLDAWCQPADISNIKNSGTVGRVCAVDQYCCLEYWDATCVAESTAFLNAGGVLTASSRGACQDINYGLTLNVNGGYYPPIFQSTDCDHRVRQVIKWDSFCTTNSWDDQCGVKFNFLNVLIAPAKSTYPTWVRDSGYTTTSCHDHIPMVVGAAYSQGCIDENSFIASTIAIDPNCATSWDSYCVSTFDLGVKTRPCIHLPTVVGVALDSMCSATNSIVASVLALDPICKYAFWDSICVASYNGGGVSTTRTTCAHEGNVVGTYLGNWNNVAANAALNLYTICKSPNATPSIAAVNNAALYKTMQADIYCYWASWDAICVNIYNNGGVTGPTSPNTIRPACAGGVTQPPFQYANVVLDPVCERTVHWVSLVDPWCTANYGYSRWDSICSITAQMFLANKVAIQINGQKDASRCGYNYHGPSNFNYC